MKKKHSNLKVGTTERVTALFFVFQLLVFLPALQKSIPWSDDWGYIFYADDRNKNLFHDAMASGRPILGFISQLAYQNSFITSNLIVIQLIALSGLLLLQVSLYKKLKKYNFAQPIAIFLPLTLILIPGFQSYVYFLSCFPYSWSCFFGFISYGLISSRAPNRMAIGGSLLILSFLIYPAGSMFYFLSYFIDFMARFRENTKFLSNINHLVKATLKFLSFFLLSVLIARAISSLYGIKQASRIEPINSLDSLFEKVVWVMSRIFVSEYRIFTVASPTPRQAATELIIVVATLTFFVLKPQKGLNINRILNFSLMLFIPLLGALPNLIIRENQFEFRTLTATYAISLVFWVFCINEILQRIFTSSYRKGHHNVMHANKALYATFISLVLLITFYVQEDSKNLWVKPSIERDEITLAALNNNNFNGRESICMVIPQEVFSPLNKLGIYSIRTDLVSSWVPEPYMRMQLKNFKVEEDIRIFVKKDMNDCDKSNTLIDYKSLGETD